MFRHRGKNRTFSHNLRVASLLSFVAGMVNVTGFLAVQRLTTNITGHFAFFVDEVFKLNLFQAFVYFMYVIFFLLGSFASNFIIEIISRKNERYIFIVPVSIEILILLIIAFSGQELVRKSPDIIACSLLFAMGLQNSLVTTISNAVVRTTHLTGLFTDLGIELSQLFFYKTPGERQKLRTSIKLRMTIIGFFFSGGMLGGILYSRFGILTLCAGAFTLIAGLIYDYIKFKIIRLKRKYSAGHQNNG